MASTLKSNIKNLGLSIKGLIYALMLAMAFVQGPSPALAAELGKPSWTAENNAAYRAIGALDPDPAIRNPDYLAEKFVSPEFWKSSYLKPNFDASKRIIDAYGLAGYYTINARTKHIDTLLRKALADGAKQVVILGAGYDSRAYRFQDASPTVAFFEVDLPITQAEKKRRVAQIFGAVPDTVVYVPIDFNTQTLGEVLKRAGYDEKLRTFFIWEGVTMYIDGDAVDSTIRFIAQHSAPGSSVVLDYVLRGLIEGKVKDRACTRAMTKVATKGEPWIFGLEKVEAERFLEERGLRVLSNFGPEDQTRRYLMKSNGTVDGEMFRCGGILLGAVLGAGTK